jgi:hypothetical protein
MSTPMDISVSLADVRRWEEECVRLDAEIAARQARREKFAQMIALAREVAAEATAVYAVAPEAAENSTADPAAEAPPRLKHGGSRRREDTWKYALEVLVKAHPEGISYDRLKEQVPPKLKEQLKAFPAAKGFHKALRVLHDEKVIVRDKGIAFPKKAYDKYLAQVKAGRAKPIETPKRESPIADAVLEFLRKNGPAKGAAIRAHLVQFPGFGPSVLRNSSALYNVLLRLKERGEIVHDAEAATYSIAQENGAPAEASAPDAGRAATLPFENVVGFRPR